MRHLYKPLKLSLPAIAASLLLAACGSSSNGTAGSAPVATNTAQTGSSTGVVLHTVSSPTYGAILVDSQGMTLYHLSAEQGGRFICTSASCVAIWHPLLASSGSPSGVSALGTVRRPDGTLQVTYEGEPLYTFAQDHGAGETNGEGIRDVGTWSVVATGSPGTSTTSTGGGSAGTAGGGYGSGESSESTHPGGSPY